MENADQILSIIEEYRILIVDDEKKLGMINDVSLLPIDKDTLKVYLLIALSSKPDKKTENFLEHAFLMLAEFQPNIGEISPLSASKVESMHTELKNIDQFDVEKFTESFRGDIKIFKKYEELVENERIQLLEILNTIKMKKNQQTRWFSRLAGIITILMSIIWFAIMLGTLSKDIIFDKNWHIIVALAIPVIIILIMVYIDEKMSGRGHD